MRKGEIKEKELELKEEDSRHPRQVFGIEECMNALALSVEVCWIM